VTTGNFLTLAPPVRQALYVDHERLIDSGRPSRRSRDLAFDLGPRKRRPYAAQSLASVSSWLAFPRPRSSESENESEAPVFILAAVTDFCQDGQFSLLRPRSSGGAKRMPTGSTPTS
jgi:hypothetical protein